MAKKNGIQAFTDEKGDQHMLSLENMEEFSMLTKKFMTYAAQILKRDVTKIPKEHGVVSFNVGSDNFQIIEEGIFGNVSVSIDFRVPDELVEYSND